MHKLRGQCEMSCREERETVQHAVPSALQEIWPAQGSLMVVSGFTWVVSPIRCVQEIDAAVDARAGIQTSPFVMPNDERAHKVKGDR